MRFKIWQIVSQNSYDRCWYFLFHGYELNLLGANSLLNGILPFGLYFGVTYPARALDLTCRIAL